MAELTFEPVYNRIFAQLRNGEKVTCGQVEISPEGLHWRPFAKAVYRWDEIGEAIIANGCFIVFAREGGKAKLRMVINEKLGKVPDAFVIAALTREYSAYLPAARA